MEIKINDFSETSGNSLIFYLEAFNKITGS